MMAFRSPERSPGRALAKLTVLTLLLGVMLAAGAWWALATGWDALLDALWDLLPLGLPRVR
ncbi:hypothetical protein [Planomonospora venezuelensis]|uniref:Uncharacterized protein n=1 Tax=Planomonospora venezuelensis TaxID=1999 RepID=A0A841D2Q6_PLAVE|nr:hypothetical protein [Planomonospora venezuelensis]MBB5962678.1 hypothetical protein [Planomonospora venezuelensis]